MTSTSREEEVAVVEAAVIETEVIVIPQAVISYHSTEEVVAVTETEVTVTL